MAYYDENPEALDESLRRSKLRDLLFPQGSWSDWILCGDPDQPYEVHARRELRRIEDQVLALLPSDHPALKVTR